MHVDPTSESIVEVFIVLSSVVVDSRSPIAGIEYVHLFVVFES